METVRLRLVFDQVLSNSQKTKNLKQSWILLKPQHQTISDLSSYILNAFDLQNDCPRGLLLSMEGFALPPFESTSLLKDRDIISVEKNGGGSSEIVMIGDESNPLEVVEIVETQPVVAGVNLLANEEFEKESGGYRSEEEEEEEEEDAPEQVEDEVHVENTPEVKKVSKKRKASKELKSCSKRKKKKSATAEERFIVEPGGSNVSGEGNGTSCTAKVDERIESSKTLTSAKGISPCQENSKGRLDASSTPNGTKKSPCRSARRKKAQRRLKRERRDAERRVLRQRQLREESDELSSEEDSEGVSQESAEKGNQVSEQVPERDNEECLEGCQQQDQDSDVEDDVVPVVIRPGHIRFEPLRKVGANQSLQQSQVPLNNFHWNGITSKKKGQKWGKEKVTSYKRNNYKNVNQERSEILSIEATPKPSYDRANFEKLEFYTSLPKEGDVIAYRVLELSSSLTPELSSYRVGKISQYDIEKNNVRLVPVRGYPVIPEKEMGYHASGGLSEANPCTSDGSTWREFSALCEVRLVAKGNLNSVNSVAGGVSNGNQDNGTSFRPKNANEARSSAQENGEVDPWEQINHALEAKKAQLSQEDNWNKIQSSHKEDNWNKRGSSSQVDKKAQLSEENNWIRIQSSHKEDNWNKSGSSSQVDNWKKTQSSGRRPWSHRTLRGSAMGPTMAMLRAQNEL